jgi:hypothetical protein
MHFTPLRLQAVVRLMASQVFVCDQDGNRIEAVTFVEAK